MTPVAVDMMRASDEHVILKAKSDTSRNLVIWAACFDVVNRTMVVPVQELKAVLQDQLKAKETKVGSSAVETQSRENPDSSRGLFVTRAVLEQAKLVQEARQQKRKLTRQRRRQTLPKCRVATKKLEAFSGLTVKMDGLKNHNPAGDLKLA